MVCVCPYFLAVSARVDASRVVDSVAIDRFFGAVMVGDADRWLLPLL